LYGFNGRNREKRMVDKKTQGKKNRKSGAAFELKVRKDLEEQGWSVSKYQNNLSDYPESNINLPSEQREDRKLIPAKPKYNPFTKSLMMNKAGFPDFICTAIVENASQQITDKSGKPRQLNLYVIMGCEVKSNGYLSKEEKEKCKWLIDNKIFSNITIASKGKKRGEIVYTDFFCKELQEEDLNTHM
jgi:hypothetical protein